MDVLRVILIVVGVVIITAVYFVERARRRRTGARLEQPEPERFEYSDDVLLKDEPSGEVLDRELEKLSSIVTEEWRGGFHDEVAVTSRPRAAEATKPTRPAPPVRQRDEARAKTQARSEPPGPALEKIIVLHVMAPEQRAFPGERIRAALEAVGLVYGQMRIFHRLTKGLAGEPIFSVANMLEPGWFDLEQMDSFVTPGVTLFMRLPGPVACMAAFDEMMAIATKLAEALNGELRDETRSVLSRQTIEHMREEIREFQRRLRLAQKIS